MNRCILLLGVLLVLLLIGGFIAFQQGEFALWDLSKVLTVLCSPIEPCLLHSTLQDYSSPKKKYTAPEECSDGDKGRTHDCTDWRCRIV
jgi:hypothetical protein